MFNPYGGGGGFGGYNAGAGGYGGGFGGAGPQGGYGVAPGGYGMAPGMGTGMMGAMGLMDAYGAMGGGGMGGGYDHRNCNFYMRMGACRHGENCGRVHPRPERSTTVLLPMMYPNPSSAQFMKDKAGQSLATEYDARYMREHAERFYADVWQTIMEFGTIVEMRVVDNLCEHLLGNVYIKFATEEAAQAAVDGLRKKLYNGILLLPELSIVRDLSEACCREDKVHLCKRGAACNYLHVKKVSRTLLSKLHRAQDKLKARKARKAEREEKRRLRLQEKQKEKERKEKEKGDARKAGTEHSKSGRRQGSRRRSPEGDRRAREGPVCHVCGKRGHLSRECPKKHAR